MIKPISPNEIAEHKAKIFPDFVIKSFNDLIAKNFSSGSAEVVQGDVIDEILKNWDLPIESSYRDDDVHLLQSQRRKMIFDEGWLNVEEIYRAEGWLVEYDKPAYNESYRAFFEFRKAK
jgi:hypothetical protein